LNNYGNIRQRLRHRHIVCAQSGLPNLQRILEEFFGARVVSLGIRHDSESIQRSRDVGMDFAERLPSNRQRPVQLLHSLFELSLIDVLFGLTLQTRRFVERARRLLGKWRSTERKEDNDRCDGKAS
jgi:hypothetical protein